MSSAIPQILRPLFRTNNGFLISSSNLPDKWITRKKNYAGINSRFSIFPYNSSHPLCSSLSLCSTCLFSCPSLCFLFQSHSPHLRSPFSSMTAQSSSDPPQSSSTKTVRVMIKGRVQGVFYRNWTIENANQLGLKGWVRNRRDGSVEALFSGDSDKVQEMEQRCRHGPPDAMVTGLQVFPCDDDPGTGFHRKPTI
ncbi:uncharacterized protein LOC8284487 isoform X1 [Ricinus communis]|uniref:acylphosphatase n=1 Tax=Ricinus communis TaxID=3988 RepID=B9S0H5_RICCO|nr:uncharacterized protein LOC8284487 isoform X1 [Ricinus communis]EEF42908.1 acylphosphatase, putative [Ricinus communis]|eukprot:XP_002519494.1 uncharacterized protein LOC8284487 isoform X1 [Ricinus communis]